MLYNHIYDRTRHPLDSAIQSLQQSSIAVVHKIRAVLSRYPQVDAAILYGSRAKGNYKNGSDIDLTPRGRSDLSLKVLFRILDDLDELLLPYTIDLSIFQRR